MPSVELVLPCLWIKYMALNVYSLTGNKLPIWLLHLDPLGGVFNFLLCSLGNPMDILESGSQNNAANKILGNTKVICQNILKMLNFKNILKCGICASLSTHWVADLP